MQNTTSKRPGSMLYMNRLFVAEPPSLAVAAAPAGPAVLKGNAAEKEETGIGGGWGKLADDAEPWRCHAVNDFDVIINGWLESGRSASTTDPEAWEAAVYEVGETTDTIINTRWANSG